MRHPSDPSMYMGSSVDSVGDDDCCLRLYPPFSCTAGLQRGGIRRRMGGWSPLPSSSSWLVIIGSASLTAVQCSHPRWVVAIFSASVGSDKQVRVEFRQAVKRVQWE